MVLSFLIFLRFLCFFAALPSAQIFAPLQCYPKEI